MNIPLDNIYHWIRSLANEPVSIYTFRPHGSKNINDLDFFEKKDSNIVAPEIVCHDQEPLNYAEHQNYNMLDLWKNSAPTDLMLHPVVDALASATQTQDLNFYSKLRVLKPKSIFDRYILLHSEKNSNDVAQFSRTAETVYYWFHGIISRDWYRFAHHDARLTQQVDCKQTFLVYCRAWTGSREYRLKFLDFLIEEKLIKNCRVSVLHNDAGIPLHEYQSKNLDLQPVNIKKIAELPNNSFDSGVSADYCPNDIVETNISVVLETIADSQKIHLTEKTLRPIACGHPFMLVAGPGALEYLKSYGFKTFSPWINEEYDQELNIINRMKLIVKEMTRIKELDLAQKTQFLTELRKIAEYNKQHFFSKEFAQQLQHELTDNLNRAIDRVKFTQGYHYLLESRTFNKFYRHLPKLDGARERNVETLKILKKLRKDPTISIKKIVDQFPQEFFLSSVHCTTPTMVRGVLSKMDDSQQQV
jgi:hypothetical protein